MQDMIQEKNERSNRWPSSTPCWDTAAAAWATPENTCYAWVKASSKKCSQTCLFKTLLICPLYDGTSAIMLSGETAIGKYPVETVKTMATIAERTENDIDYVKRLDRMNFRESGKAIADELTLRDEVIDPTKPHVIFDPNATWKTKELTDFTVRELQVPIFQNGELVYELPELNDIKAYCRQQIHTLWDEVKRFENPHTYYVDLSQKLWDVKRGLLEAAKC